MPATATILLAILILGPLLTLASTIWGLVSETSYTDEQGAKRLNKAGQVAIGLAFGSALVSTTALGMRTIVEQQQADNTARKSAQKEADERQIANDNKR